MLETPHVLGLRWVCDAVVAAPQFNKGGRTPRCQKLPSAPVTQHAHRANVAASFPTSG